jgi:hypothetical protein
MFRCEHCKLLSKSGEKSEQVVVSRFAHVFPFRAFANSFRREGARVSRPDSGGKGLQIAHEVRVHQRCVAKVKIGGILESEKQAVSS